MSQPKPATPSPALNLQDILYVLFKHKWKIILLSTLGIGAAAVVYFLDTPLYESQAKLLVRYVVDRNAIDPEMSDKSSKFGDAINSEVQIFKSLDLATQVANTIGPQLLLPGVEGVTAAAAARSIRAGLTAGPAGKGSNVIQVSYRDPNPEFATSVLNELIRLYFVKHLEVHRSAEAFNFVTQQSDQVKARLDHTEEQLKQVKSKARITNLAESTALVNAELSSIQGALQSAKTEYAEQQARLAAMETLAAAQASASTSPQKPHANDEVVQRYKSLTVQLDDLRRTQMELLAKYGEQTAKPGLPDELQRARQVRNPDEPTSDKRNRSALLPDDRRPLGFIGLERDTALALARERYRQQNDTGFAYQGGKKDFDMLVREAQDEILGRRVGMPETEKAAQLELVKINQMQIENLEQQRSDLQSRYPELLTTSTAAVRSQSEQASLESERARLAGIEARTTTLGTHLRDVQKRAEELSELAPQIARLERAREVEENNYKYFQASLEKARIDEALDPTKIPNISVVQKPSPALRTTSDLKKIVLGLAGGGIALGLALAFLLEVIMDRTVKRPIQLEKLLGAPILLSIPYLNGRTPPFLRWPKERSLLSLGRTPHLDRGPWEADHFIRPFSEAIRDRLVLFFELSQMNHKPKLVAVTGCSNGSGSSTIAGGLAAALSETGDGKVLLVDMNIGRPEMHPFFNGSPACSLSEALVGEPAQAGDNLYLATATQPNGQNAQLIPRKFYELMPHLKASAFDYIIFDMPPFSQTSIALPMSRFMDKVLLVAESGKSGQDIVKRAKAELGSVGPSVSVILNKVRSYTPKWLGVEG